MMIGKSNAMCLTSESQHKIEILSERRLWPVEILRTWSRLSTTVHQSQQFDNHLRTIGTKTALAVIRTIQDSNGDTGLLQIVPLRFGTVQLCFGNRSYYLWIARLRSLELQGSRPLGQELAPNTAGHTYNRLISDLFDCFPDVQVIRLAALPADCTFYSHLVNSLSIRRIAISYSIRGVRPCSVANLPATWAEYLKLLGSKRRHNTERQIRRTKEHGGGVLQLVRIEHAAQLDELYRAIETLGGHLNGRDVGGGGHTQLASLAANKLLLGYILYCGTIPCGVTLGLQADNQYYMDSIHVGMLPPKLSPGSSLLHMLVEDLIKSAITKIDYGFGEPKYGYSRINTTHPRIDLLLMRRNLVNRALSISHRLCQNTMTYVKHKLTGNRTVTSTTSEQTTTDQSEQ